MITIGLTGNVASGKSTVARAWADAGIPVVSADELARLVILPGSEALELIARTFGEHLVLPDSSLDRAALREIVFHDDEARRRLEAIMHPRIEAARLEWFREREAEGDALVVAEIPLLFEIGGEDDYDRVVVVDAPPDVRLRRMIEDRGLDETVARRIQKAQLDPALKRERADVVIANHASLEALRHEAAERLGDFLREVGQGSVTPADPIAWHSVAPQGWMRLDLHMHTRGSWDCMSNPEELLARARERGLDRIAITDHDRLHVARRMYEKYPDLVVPGEEVKTAEGIDVIGWYLREEIPKGTPMRETIERIREQGGVPCLPHPFAPGKGGDGRFAEELAPLVDVVEVFNARLHPAAQNDPAEVLARRFGRLRSAGSDAHTVDEVGGAYVEVPRHENTPDGLRSALRYSRVHGREASRLVHLASTWAKVRKKLPGTGHSE